MQSIPAQTYDELPRDPVVTALKAASVVAFLILLAGLLWCADGVIRSMFERDPNFASFIMAPWVAPTIVIGFVCVVVGAAALLASAARGDAQ